MVQRDVRRLVAAVAVALALAACGGSSGSGDDTSAGSTAPSTTEKENAKRPEGRWTLVSTQLERSDVEDLDPGLSGVRLSLFEPSCPSGPCDIGAAPAGKDGTYLPEGATASASAAEPEPYTLVWDGKAKTYSSTVEKVTSCTTADLDEIEDAYEVKTTTVLRFRPVNGAAPPQLTGTYAQTVAPTDAGRAAGCTPFEDTGTVVGAPTDAMLGDDDLDVAGTYTTTEIVESVEPAGQRPPGFMGLLGAFTIADEGDGLTITGALDAPADLTASDTGFGGATSEVSGPCDTTADGYASTETWIDLAPVARTSSGTPILAGRWELSQEPTPAGTDAGCSLTSNTGYVVLVPTSSLG